MFCISQFSSQTCERLFRAARSMSTTYSTVINFSIKDFIQKIERIKCVNSIISDVGGVFNFPREEKTHLLGEQKLQIGEEDIKSFDNKSCVEQARTDALTFAETLGMESQADDWKIVDIPLQYSKTTTATAVDAAVDVIDKTEDDTEVDEIYYNQSSTETDITTNIIFDNEELKLDDLHLKDFSNKVSPDTLCDTSQFVQIKLNNKIMVVKKSSYCWLMEESCGKVSTDRLRRFIKNTKKVNTLTRKSKSIEKKVKRDKVPSDISSEEGSIIYDDTEDDTDAESHSSLEVEHKESSDMTEDSLDIVLDKFYAVYYDEIWYIGKIIKILGGEDTQEMFKMKFLHFENDIFHWPKIDDEDIIKNREFIFYGPIDLIGVGPYQIKRRDLIDIKRLYESMK